jgi:hypothetical protein
MIAGRIAVRVAVAEPLAPQTLLLRGQHCDVGPPSDVEWYRAGWRWVGLSGAFTQRRAAGASAKQESKVPTLV